MTRERILDTRPDGSVAITCPDENGIRYLMLGSDWWQHPWHERPWWFWIVQFQRKVARGVKPAAAYKFCRAMVTGGLSRREAIELIGEYSVGHLGVALEIVDISEIPTDRTYRDAWRRSSNGGPIWVCEKAAQEIDEARMWRLYETA